jgi:hypothetical protein
MRVVIRSSATPGLLASLLSLVACAISLTLLHSGFARPDGGLGMRVQMQGDAILLSWNRDIAAVRTAKKGVLQIEDGAQKHRTELEPDQLANGSILYNPTKADVDFNLTVYGTDGSTVTDHLQVLGGSKRRAILIRTNRSSVS